MTQEEKELLLKDLCARLPYDVKVNCNDKAYNFAGIHSFNICILSDDNEDNAFTTAGIKYIKPYLFPLSSMTEEQKEELKNEISKQTDILIERMKNDDCGIDCGKYHFHSNLELEWLLKNHFDYRGLIPKGLAIDATGLNIY